MRPNSGPSSEPTRLLLELAGVFLKLGCTAFGGPAAHAAMMEQEFVRKRAWFSHEQFLDMLGTVNLLPGPTSTEMAILIGYRRAGWLGLVLAGACFILPATMLVTGIAWGYQRFGALPNVTGILYGIKPVIIAILAQALWNLGRVAVTTCWLALVGLAALTLNLLGANPFLILLGAGALAAIVRALVKLRKTGLVACLAPFFGFGSGLTSLPSVAALGAPVSSAVPFSLGSLFFFFFKVGAFLFGSGYLLLAFVRADLVEHWHWLTERQLLDAIAVGQFTPGPILTTATFIGFLLGGLSGAIVATIGIFLPAFLIVAVSGPLVPRLRQWPIANTFLDAVIVASLALMLVITGRLAFEAITDWITLALTLISSFFLLRYRLNSAWLVLAGASLGLLVSLWK
jgi:chromate transporter